jgi:hypothetical protein
VLLAQRTAYCLRAVNIIEAAGKRGRTPLHQQVFRGEPGPVARSLNVGL